MIDGEWVLRLPPRASHESICATLHAWVRRSILPATPMQLLESRSEIALAAGQVFRPDLAVLPYGGGKPFLVAEVINQEDHHPDTVLKKDVYEALRIPRLWMVDPRYENVEVYHASQHGLVLKQTLMIRETLEEPLVPGFSLALKLLFGGTDSGAPWGAQKDF